MGKAFRRAGDIESDRPHPAGEPIPGRVRGGECGKLGIDLDQGDVEPGTRAARASPAAPTPAPRSTT